MINRDFYTCDGITLAKKLLGKTLVRRIGGDEIGCVITETEAYMGVIDKASHAYGGRMTERTKTMYKAGGYSYVYLIYGMYSCMNVTANAEGLPEAVLIRAVMPYTGLDLLCENVKKYSRRKNLPDKFDTLTPKDIYSLTNGPGKLCTAMNITKALNGLDMLESPDSDFFIRDDGFVPGEILSGPRIGIDYAEEDAMKPWRFYVNVKNGKPDFSK